MASTATQPQDEPEANQRTDGDAKLAKSSSARETAAAAAHASEPLFIASFGERAMAKALRDAICVWLACTLVLLPLLFSPIAPSRPRFHIAAIVFFRVILLEGIFLLLFRKFKKQALQRSLYLTEDAVVLKVSYLPFLWAGVTKSKETLLLSSITYASVSQSFMQRLFGVHEITISGNNVELNVEGVDEAKLVIKMLQGFVWMKANDITPTHKLIRLLRTPETPATAAESLALGETPTTAPATTTTEAPQIGDLARTLDRIENLLRDGNLNLVERHYVQVDSKGAAHAKPE